METILVVAEQDEGQLKQATLAAVSFARKVATDSGGSFLVLVLGSGLEKAVQALKFHGAAALLVADDPLLARPLADKYAQLVAQVVREKQVTLVVGAASTFSKDVLPRAAGLLDAAMVSDVVDVQPEGGELLFRRVLYAGNALAVVKLSSPIKVVTIRAAAFPASQPSDSESPLEAIAVDPARLPQGIEFESCAAKQAGRPDSTEARVVVSGGRAIKNSEDFERLVGGLADVLGAAVGSSRALVDAGITPNELQIGQTGKIVAPDLYLAVGISGAIQHLAGMKDTKVIAAINKDAEAPIFEIADYGLVADVYQAVPELIEKLRG